MNTNEMENVTATEVTEEAVNNQDTLVIVKKPNIVDKFKGLKTWQKVLIGVGVVGGLAVGGTAVVKAVAKKPEVVKEVAEKVAEAVTESPEVVVDTVAEVVTE